MEKRAGIESFEAFGFYNAVNSLAGGDVLRWDSVMMLPYDQFFLKQYMNKVEAAYQKKYQELMEKQAMANGGKSR